MGRNALCGIIFTICLLAPTLARADLPMPWLPQESWPGGRQADARLDRTVTFWGAGLPLAKVFAGVREQTGVQIGFDPANGDNARICVNLFLNPKQPPTLRDLMAQLAWVTDCNFAASGEGTAQTYALLSTTLGDDITERLRARAKRRAAELRRDARLEAKARRDEAVAKLNELRNAMDLTQGQALAKYRGADDLLLLALLDPARRSVAQAYLSLSPNELHQLQPGRRLDRGWGGLSPDQKALLEQAAQPQLDAMNKAAQAAGGDSLLTGGDWESLSGRGLRLDVEISAEGTFEGTIWVPLDWRPNGRAAGEVGITLPRLPLVADPLTEANPATSAHLEVKQLLGEPVTDTDRRKATEQQQREHAAAVLKRRLERQRRDLAPLSADTTALLSSVHLNLQKGQEYALWQIQEAVAAATGLNVISDCFWQPPRQLGPSLAVLSGETAPTALEALQVSCMCDLDESRDPSMALESGRADLPPWLASWEWGSAGDILRFRSDERDVWRSAFLPRKALQTVDAWLSPYLPQASNLAQLPPIIVPLDPRQIGALAAQLTRPQRTWGRLLTYGDPTDPRTAYRQRFLRSALAALTESAPLYHLFASLDDAQWERFRSEGLRWNLEVHVQATPEERERGAWEAWSTGDVIRLRKLDPGGYGSEEFGQSTDWWRFEEWHGNDLTEYLEVPMNVIVHPAPLVAPGKPKAEQETRARASLPLCLSASLW